MLEQDLLKTDIAGYMARQADKHTLRFITCGSVDDGKSTLIGRLASTRFALSPAGRLTTENPPSSAGCCMSQN